MAEKNNRNGRQEVERCSFCGAPITEVAMLFSGANGAAICDQCIARGYETLSEHHLTAESAARDEARIDRSELMKPAEIKAFLDQYVIGQDAAKKTLSVAVYNHYKRLLHLDEAGRGDDVEIDKSHSILVG